MFGFDYHTDLDLCILPSGWDYIRPSTVTKAARRIAKKAGLAGVSLHTMRHSHGSQLLSLGVPLPTVSKRFGHANVHVTATIYRYALPQDEIAAAEIWNKGMKRSLKGGARGTAHSGYHYGSVRWQLFQITKGDRSSA